MRFSSVVKSWSSVNFSFTWLRMGCALIEVRVAGSWLAAMGLLMFDWMMRGQA
jgi:hypothetical protein